jgi:type I restriction enzyme S subunit
MSWSYAKLCDVAAINPRRPVIERSDDELTSFVPMDAVDEILGGVVRQDVQPYSKVKKGYTYFQNDDVIFAKITPCMQNGKHAVVKELKDGFGFGSTEFHVIRTSEKVLPEWIHFFLRKQETLDAATKTFTGAVGQQRVPTAFLEALVLPLPPVNVQRQIATRLNAQLAEVEVARQASEKQWEEVKKLKSKALEAVFADVNNWQPLGSAARVQSGYAFKSESFKRSGVRLLRNANILPGEVYWDDTVCLSEDDAESHPNYVLQAGDVLISLDRPIISSGIKVARVQSSDLPALLLQRVGRFVLNPDKLDAGYLYAYLQTERFIAQISGHEQSVGVPHISPGQVESVLMPLPDLNVQKEIATRLTQMTEAWSDAVQAIRQQREDLAALPQRLLAQAFNHREET